MEDDWEVLHGSDTESTDSITSDQKSRSSSVIDDGMILSDHFSADTTTDLSQSGVIESGDSSRVDYGSEPPIVVEQLGDACVRNELGIYDSRIDLSQSGVIESGDCSRVDYGSEPPVVVDLGDACVLNELGVYDSKIGFSGDDGEGRLSDFDESKCLSESDEIEVGDGKHVESQSSVEEPIEDLSKSCSDSGGNELVSGDSEIVNGEEEVVSDNGVVSIEEVGVVRCCDESKSKEIVWWKMPFLLLKYYVFKIGPVWSVSMAAAVMGLVLLGRRRLYNMKKKAQRFHLQVTIDEKKVSRVMSQAARLNEAFTEVRRVPVIRSVLPSPLAWPVLSLR